VSVRRSAPRSRRALGLAALVGLASGACNLLLIASGPKFSLRREPIADGVAAADHRERDRLRLLVFGDSGTGKDDQRKVAGHMAQECAARGGCDLALMLGDNIYGHGVARSRERDGRVVFDVKFAERFERVYQDLGRLDFWAIAGNHDWYSAESVDAQIAYTRHSERWRFLAHDYAVPLLPSWIRIYGLDTTKLERGRDGGQVERARGALCGGGGWKILIGHHPLYSSGWHGNARGEYPKMIDPLLEPLLEACGVHFYLSGHDHHQEHLSAPGFEQIVQGAAGKLRDVNRIARRSPGVEQLGAASLFGFALLEATAERLEVRFFGYGPGRRYSAWHCRAYERASFGEPERRSVPCRP